MLGPFKTNKDRTVAYRGNKLLSRINDVTNVSVPILELENRVNSFKTQEFWGGIARLNHQINLSVNEYFDSIGALFTTLPLTTRMISSPGAVYGKKAISYTTDTTPITLKWFDLSERGFLSESSQIYLELALMQRGVNQVYSVYNSFRKEKADSTHLSEFHHIEYEGQVSQKENEKIALGLVGKILKDLINKNEEYLYIFLSNDKIKQLDRLATNIQNIPKLTYMEALGWLYKETKNEKYKRFTMQDNFGMWEEIKLTELLDSMVAIREFPLLEVPFYHAAIHGKDGLKVADNTDIIWPGYREAIGSGHRVRSKQELKDKVKIFQLPKKDYGPYLQTRRFKEYRESSGFGLGWERMLQGLLEMPFIWSASQFPRVDKTLKP